MFPFFAIIIAVFFVMMVFHYWKRLLDVDELIGEEWKEFLRWLCTGLIVPFVLWVLFNMGWIGDPAWAYVSPISSGFGLWWNSFRLPAGAGLFFISSYWAGISFVQLVWRAGRLTEDAEKFRRRALICSAVLVPAAVLIVLFGRWAGVGLG